MEDNQNNIEEVNPVVIPKGEKTKKSNTLVIFLIIIILVLLGICGYFVYDKYFSNKPSVPSTNEQINNSVDDSNANINDTNDNNQLSNNTNNDSLNNNGVVLTDAQIKEFVKDLIDKYYGAFYHNMNVVFGKFDDRIKVGMAISHLDPGSVHILEVSSFNESDHDKLKSLVCFYSVSNFTAFKVKEVESKYKELFNEEMPNVESPSSASLNKYYLFEMQDG
nr:hypothetical protein [Bacilli bacterium]